MFKRQGEIPTKRFERAGGGQNKDAISWASFDWERYL